MFHDASHLKVGLDSLVTQMTENKAERIDVTRYVLQLMHLASKLIKKPDRIAAIAKGIEIAKARA